MRNGRLRVKLIIIILNTVDQFLSNNTSVNTLKRYNLGVKQGNSYVSPLEDIILILKLRNGPDHYITLEGGFQFSSFGMPLKVLTSTALKEKAISDFSFPADYETINMLGNEFERINLFKSDVKNI